MNRTNPFKQEMSGSEWKLGSKKDLKDKKKGLNGSQAGSGVDISAGDRPQTAGSVRVELVKKDTSGRSISRPPSKKVTLQDSKGDLGRSEVESKANYLVEDLMEDNEETDSREDQIADDEQKLTSQKLISGRTQLDHSTPLTSRQIEEIRSVMKEIKIMLDLEAPDKEGDWARDAQKIDLVIQKLILFDLDFLDRIETENIRVYNPITRHCLRKANQQHELVKIKYLGAEFHIVEVAFKLMSRNFTALGNEDEKLTLMISVLTLVLNCFEIGMFPTDRLRALLGLLFKKTDLVIKQEEYICENYDYFNIKKPAVYGKLMECKSLASRILLQLVTQINDEWLFTKTQQNQIDVLVAVQKTTKWDFVKKMFSTSTAPAAPTGQQDGVKVFLCDAGYYSFFSFIMFNYLLKELRQGEKLITDKLYMTAMQDLILYVYDYREDPFVQSVHLLKSDYLPYYIAQDIELDHIKRANQILQLITKLNKQFSEGVYQDEAQNGATKLEADVGNIFGTLEILMGLQDETFSIRLMLTEKKIPELITMIFVYMQEVFQRENGSGDELFIQGLKVLYQLSKGNYPGQAQITKSKAWENLKKLIKGGYSVFTILFLKQLFEEDPKYLHMNTKFARDLIEEFRLAFDRFSDGFRKRVPPQAKDLVTLFIFKSLVKLFLETDTIPESLKQSYNLPIGYALSNMVQNFAFPIFMENYMKIEQRYEPKLITKNWKLEDGSFLSSLMMLTGDHIICMTVDFAFSLIKLYNKSCENYFSSDLYKGMEATISTYDMSKFKYLFTFSEGLQFKTEILNSYTVFRIFANCSKIQEKYTPVELATDGVDTTLDYMPDSHIEDVPNMIISELDYLRQVFEQKEKYSNDDIVDYLLRGVCSLIYKYCNGLRWFFLSTEKEELRNKLTVKITELKKKFVGLLTKYVIDDQDLKKLKIGATNIKTKKDRSGNNTYDLDNIEAMMMQKIITDPQSGLHGAVGEALQSTIAYIELVISLKPKYQALSSFVESYRLNLKQYDLKDLNMASRMLRCEASYLNAVGRQTINYDDEEEPIKSTSNEWVTLVQLVRNYKDLKRNFLKSKSKNKFYELLESKMEDANQANLVSYCCQALENVSFQVSSYNSLWYSKSSLNTIIFLNNTMFWCPNTRKKLFEYLDKYPDRRTRIISNIYKGFRDSFTILAYTPFFTEQLECIFSRFYIFGSFIRGICNQNCQEFKSLLGTFIAKVDCPNYSALRQPVLVDLTNVLIKFFNFSGVSFNKKDDEFPSDRLSKSFLLTVVLRCIIDMVTGPCKQNQLLVYNHGSIVWINMFSRVVLNLDSKYYSVMNIILDYLLALIEGKNKTILRSFSTNFDVPLLYGVMTKLMTYLWKRVHIKRRQTEIRRQLTELKKNEPGTGANQGSTFSLQSNDSSRLDLQSENLRNLILKDSSGKPIEKVDNWTDLITMYMNDDFENHIALSCSIKIFIFLSRVSYESKKYQIFFDLKDSQLKVQYVAAGFKEEDIRLNKVILKGKTQAPEENIVYYFMRNITSRVEIKDGTGFSEIFIFPKRPMCFFLRETTKLNFRDTCNIENTEAKLIDMFESFDQFYSEMESSQKFKSQYRVIGKLATDRGFTILRIVCYLISITINVILLYNTEFEDFRVLVTETATIANTVLSSILIMICLGCIVLWIMSSSDVAWAESLRKFKAKHPYRNPYQPINLAAILFEIFMRKDVINFMVHFILSVWGLGWSSLAQVVCHNHSRCI